ncbi:MAG: 2-dehydro-3-deoxyglucarate aldolase, partial [Alphaproteobacteria bacterium]|nr:2-dehydro-3-deoxyglucarate aldolase [Alphaproteobacteria bacterium]
ETRQAIAALDAIADVKGVDSVFLGPMDLAMDMGFVGQGGGNPEVRKLCAEAVKRCKARKTPIGTFVGGESDLRWAFETGFDYVSVCSDLGLVARGAEAALEKWRAK